MLPIGFPIHVHEELAHAGDDSAAVGRARPDVVSRLMVISGAAAPLADVAGLGRASPRQ